MNRYVRKSFKILLWLAGIVLGLVLLTYILIQVPAVQNFAKNKAVTFLHNKIKTPITIGKLHLYFPRRIVLENIYLEDQAGDTLLNADTISVDITLLKLLKQQVDIHKIDLRGITSHVYRTYPDSTYNFEYLIKAFVSEKTKSVDTTASMRFSVSKINLDRISLMMKDDVTGKNMTAYLHHFDTEIRDFDLEHQKFTVPKIAFDGLNVVMRQTKALSEKTITTDTLNMAPAYTYPDIKLGQIDINDIRIDYDNVVTAINSKLDLSHLRVDFNDLDLPNQKADVKLFQLDSTSGFFALGKTAQEAVEATAEEVSAALEKGWSINLDKLDLNNIDYKYDDLNSKEDQRGIDYKHLDIRDLIVDADDVFYNADTLSGKLNQLTVKESSGLDIQKMHTDFFYSEKSTRLDNLLIETPNSHIADRVRLTYPSVDSISEHLGSVGIDAQFIENKLAVRDLLLFAPFLARREPFRRNPDGVILLDGNVEGLISDISISNLRISGLGQIRFHGSGHIQGLPDVAASNFDLRIDDLYMTDADIKGMLPPASVPANIRLPSFVEMRGKFKGTLKSFNTNMLIQSSMGTASIDGTLKNITSKGRESYNATFKTTQFNLGQLLKREQEIGKVSFTATVVGSGTDLKTANAKVTGNLIEADYKGYTYRNLSLNGSANHGDVQVAASMADPNIRFDLTGTGNLNGQYPQVNMTLNLDTLNLQKLNLYEKDLSLHGKVIADLQTADVDYLNGTIDVANAIIALEGKKYRLDTIKIISVATPGTDSLDLHAEFANIHLAGQYNLSKIWPAMQHTIDHYFDTTPGKDTLIAYDPQKLTFNASVSRSPLIEQVLPDLKELEGTNLTGNFDSQNNELEIEGKIPRLRYKDYAIDNLDLNMKTEADALNYAVTLDQIAGKQIQIMKTSLSGKAEHNVLGVNLQVHDAEDKDLYRLAGEMKAANRLFEFSILPDGLLLNKQSWNVAPDNAIQFGPDGLMVRNFRISNNTQTMEINSSPQQLNAPLELSFTEFKIETFTRFITKDSLLAGGIINGHANVRNLNTYPVFTSDLTVDDFSFHGDTLGDIALKVNNEKADTYAADVRITGNGNQVNILGYYFDAGEQSRFDLNVDIANLYMKSIEGFTAGEIDHASGTVTGDLSVKGTVAAPEIRGDVMFHEVSFLSTRFNSYYKLNDDHLEFNSDGIALHDFTLTDSTGNEAVFSGNIRTTNYKDFLMDLDVNADNFQVMNSTRDNNKLYFGQLYIDTHMHIGGGYQNPTVDGTLRVNDKTNLTIVIPQEDPGIVEREGIVEFVDMDTFKIDHQLVLNDSLTRNTFTGLDVAVNVHIDKEAELNLIIDEANGDYLNVKGTADLTGGIDPSGKMTLAGLYELEEGSYRFSFNQVKREFAIRKGSTILWTGDPLKADVNVTAVYIAQTAPLSLVQSQLADAEQNVINTYKQKIPFEIQLSMQGELMKPDITFDIDLPEKNYGVSSEVTSTVRTRLTQLRTEPSELNKQVFAVLLLNRFITEDPFQNDARSGGISTLARQSASKILSEQLNNLIGGSIGGVDVNLDINSIEDYTTGELKNRTDVTVALSKQILDDRLKISVGSNFELEGPQETDRKTTNIAGDISAEFQLTRDGRYLVRAYRKDEYIIVQGQVVETGLGFVFTADYDRFKDIFTKKTEEQKFIKKQEREAKKEERNN